MANLVYSYQFTIPAGTAIATPATNAMTVDPNLIAKVTVRTPPGPHGNVGWRLDYGGGRTFPFAAGSWMVTDDAEVDFEPPSNLSSGAWSLVAYNTGVYDHTLYVALAVVIPEVARPATPNQTPLVIP